MPTIADNPNVIFVPWCHNLIKERQVPRLATGSFARLPAHLRTAGAIFYAENTRQLMQVCHTHDGRHVRPFHVAMADHFATERIHHRLARDPVKATQFKRIMSRIKYGLRRLLVAGLVPAALSIKDADNLTTNAAGRYVSLAIHNAVMRRNAAMPVDANGNANPFLVRDDRAQLLRLQKRDRDDKVREQHLRHQFSALTRKAKRKAKALQKQAGVKSCKKREQKRLETARGAITATMDEKKARCNRLRVAEKAYRAKLTLLKKARRARDAVKTKAAKTRHRAQVKAARQAATLAGKERTKAKRTVAAAKTQVANKRLRRKKIKRTLSNCKDAPAHKRIGRKAAKALKPLVSGTIDGCEKNDSCGYEELHLAKEARAVIVPARARAAAAAVAAAAEGKRRAAAQRRAAAAAARKGRPVRASRRSERLAAAAADKRRRPRKARKVRRPVRVSRRIAAINRMKSLRKRP